MIQWLMILIINLIVLEVASYLVVVGLGFLRPDRRWDMFVDTQLSGISDGIIANFLANEYDAELGWDYVPNSKSSEEDILNRPWTSTYDATGARTSCMTDTGDASNPYIATYGDSFTHGDEVNDDVTWQCALERRTKRRVANYGVAGYGVDQALLKAERHWREGRIATFTLLCIYEDDLGRALSRYRPFLSPGTGAKLGFKPSLRKIGNGVVWLPNPLRPGTITPQEVKALAISLIPTDYWASNAARVLPKFPYSVQLIRAVLRAIGRKLTSREFSGNVWDIPEGRDVMLKLVADFTNLATRHGTRPVLVMIPKTSDWGDGRKTPEYKNFLRDVLGKADSSLLIVDIDDAKFDEQKFNLLPFRGHASAYGNEVIAGAVLQGIGLSQDAIAAAIGEGE